MERTRSSGRTLTARRAELIRALPTFSSERTLGGSRPRREVSIEVSKSYNCLGSCNQNKSTRTIATSPALIRSVFTISPSAVWSMFRTVDHVSRTPSQSIRDDICPVSSSSDLGYDVVRTNTVSATRPVSPSLCIRTRISITPVSGSNENTAELDENETEVERVSDRSTVNAKLAIFFVFSVTIVPLILCTGV